MRVRIPRYASNRMAPEPVATGAVKRGLQRTVARGRDEVGIPSREARALERKVCLMYQSIVVSSWKKLSAALLALACAAALALAGCAGAEPAAGDGAVDAPATPAAEQGAESSSDNAEQGASIAVSVAMPEGADAPSETVEVSLPEGATVFDALEATGWDVQAEDSDYGKYVTAINGVANGSQGEASGWVFTVNNEQVMEGCDSCTLAAGDSVEWSFFVA